MHIIPEWIQLVCLAFSFGVISCRLWFFTPLMQTQFSYPGDFVSRLWNLFCFGLAAMTVSSIIVLFVKSGEISGKPFPAFLPIITTVLFRTHYGKVWLLLIAALILLSASKTSVRYRDSRYFLGFMLFLTLIISITRSASGHASDKGDFSIPEIADWLHLLAACFWGGGLMVLSVSVLPALIRDVPSADLTAIIAGRFSKIAGFAVLIIAVTAIYNSWMYIGSYEAIWKNPYGLAAAAKILLFLFLIGLGGYNRYISVPALQSLAGRARNGRLADVLLKRFQKDANRSLVVLHFRRLVAIEAILIVGILLCAAILRHEIPARHLSHIGHQKGVLTPPVHMH